MSKNEEACPRCGWAKHSRFSTGECDPIAGRVADELMAKFPDVKSIKLGYSQGTIAFIFGEHKILTFDVNADGRFAPNHFFWDDWSAAGAEALVRALASIQPSPKKE